MISRNLATALLLSLLITTPAFAADETLPNLSAAAPAAGTDLVPTTQGGNLLKQTLSAILTYIEGAFQKASAAQFGVVEVDGTTILASGGVISVGTIPATAVAVGALANGMTATTQSANDNSTKLATTAYADNAGKSPSGSSGDLQTNNGSGGFGTAHLNDNGSQVTASEDFDLTSKSQATEVANASSTGTTNNKLAKLTGAPSTAVIAATTDLHGIIGIVISGGGTTGTAIIAENGQASCVFDGATTAGDYVTISTSSAGECHDAGAPAPASGQLIGKVQSTNGSGGTYSIFLFAPEVVSGGSGLLAGTSVTLKGPSQIYVCTSTCTVTLPVPQANYQFCIWNDTNVATVITLAALGSSSYYENTARMAYGTSGTGTLTSAGAIGDKICIVGRDATHYQSISYQGTWTAS